MAKISTYSKFIINKNDINRIKKYFTSQTFTNNQPINSISDFHSNYLNQKQDFEKKEQLNMIITTDSLKKYYILVYIDCL